MKAIEHTIKHQYQPTSTTCSPTALSILLSAYDQDVSVGKITDSILHTQAGDEDSGTEMSGVINQHLATWALSQGFKADLYTFDCQVIDQSWAGLSKEKLLERLNARKDGWQVPALGTPWTEIYTQSYIGFIEAGGELHIQPAVSSKLLYELLQTGPLLPCVSFSTLYDGKGRTYIKNEDEADYDDVKGRALNHSIVIYGNDEKGNFLVADPFEKPGLQIIEPERMIAAISTAQIECDNLFFVLQK